MYSSLSLLLIKINNFIKSKINLNFKFKFDNKFNISTFKVVLFLLRMFSLILNVISF